MEIYLPIAQIPVNWLVVLGIGGAVGFLSGIVGVSGGFITTPLLIFYGVPADIVVSTQATPISAAALVGTLRQGRRGAVDIKMGAFLLLGGLLGSLAGVQLFRMLQRLGQIDFVVEASYVLLLGGVGGLMLSESVQAMRAVRSGRPAPGHGPGKHNWIHNLPFKMRFRASRLYISAIPVVVLGFLVGIMTAILGTGGAFLLIPAKIYLLRMRTEIAVGTAQFQMFVVAIASTMLHAVTDHTVDIVLGLILAVGGVVGAQFGVRIGANMRADQLRAFLGLLTVAIAARLLVELVLPPDHLYSIVTVAQ